MRSTTTIAIIAILTQIAITQEHHKVKLEQVGHYLDEASLAKACREYLFNARALLHFNFKAVDALLTSIKDSRSVEKGDLLKSKFSANMRYYNFVQKTFLKKLQKKLKVNEIENEDYCFEIKVYLEKLLTVLKNLAGLEGNGARITSDVQANIQRFEGIVTGLEKMFN